MGPITPALPPVAAAAAKPGKPSDTPTTPAPDPATPVRAGDPLLIKLSARADLRDVERMPRGADRKQAAWDKLSANATTSQKDSVALAQRLKTSGAVVGHETPAPP